MNQPSDAPNLGLIFLGGAGIIDLVSVLLVLLVVCDYSPQSFCSITDIIRDVCNNTLKSRHTETLHSLDAPIFHQWIGHNVGASLGTAQRPTSPIHWHILIFLRGTSSRSIISDHSGVSHPITLHILRLPDMGLVLSPPKDTDINQEVGSGVMNMIYLQGHPGMGGVHGQHDLVPTPLHIIHRVREIHMGFPYHQHCIILYKWHHVLG